MPYLTKLLKDHAEKNVMDSYDFSQVVIPASEILAQYSTEPFAFNETTMIKFLMVLQKET